MMMEAEDTVMSGVEEVDGTTFLPPDYISWREHQNLMERQAEISFKAGIREVINYLSSPDNGLSIQMQGDKWGKQLAKWFGRIKYKGRVKWITCSLEPTHYQG